MSTRMLALIVLLGLLAAPAGAAPPDEHTTFYASFDDGTGADFCRGLAAADARATVEAVPGKVGEAVAIRRGSLSYAAAGNLRSDQGTLELWLRPCWVGTATSPPVLFSFSTREGGYLNLNTVVGTRFGVAIRDHGAQPFVWRRVERAITDWQPDQWHYAAVVWTAAELHLYVDGEEVVPPVTDHAGVKGEVTSFTLGGPGVDLDEVRLSDVARTPEEIKRAYDDPGRPGMIRSLSALPVAAVEPAGAEVGRDAQPARDEARLPLVLAGQRHARGIGLYANQTATWQLDPPAAKLVGQIGLSDLNEAPGPARVEISGDGKPLWAAELAPGQAPQALAVDVSGVQRVSLKASSSAPTRQMIAFGGATLLLAGVAAPPSATAEMTPDALALARLNRDAGKVGFALPPGDKGYVLWSKCPEDEQANDQPPVGELWPKELRLFAAPGEYEPVELLLAAARALPVAVAVSDLKSDTGSIPASEVQVGLVARQAMRKGYWLKPEPANFTVVPRFIFPYRPFTLDAGTMREVFVDVHVPADAAPGTYRGTLTVQAGAQPTTVGLVCRVLPIKFAPCPKQYGMYYRMTPMLEQPARLEAELADMQRHGITLMWSGMGVKIAADGDKLQYDYAGLRQMLTALRAHGFHGPLPVEDSLMTLARAMGKQVAPGQPVDETLETDAVFLSEAKRMLDGLLPLQQEFPEFELVLTHMDEVFNNSRLPLFMQFARIADKLSPLRCYITMHTSPKSQWREMFAQVAPLVDIPCFNGHALDDYLKAGGTWAELGQMLAANKQEAWTYYNIRGSFFTAEWERIINGLYLSQAPLRVHMPWMYTSTSGDPFDDTDAIGHDFAYAAPSREDPTVLIPTLHYQALREGRDDARYLYTLKALIEQGRARRPAEAAAGQKLLDDLAASLPRIPDDLQAIEQESPWLIAISDKFAGAEYDSLRLRIAEAILKLQ